MPRKSTIHQKAVDEHRIIISDSPTSPPVSRSIENRGTKKPTLYATQPKKKRTTRFHKFMKKELASLRETSPNITPAERYELARLNYWKTAAYKPDFESN
ncbi:hypothetical protein V5O48_003724 [Marasmius crinis-equi]|uniref:Uncharacterized protein n=1 Tax=Marasmius crinis-equi TaxID=585013 RepID=A0ABR3FS37_9AGAR